MNEVVQILCRAHNSARSVTSHSRRGSVSNSRIPLPAIRWRVHTFNVHLFDSVAQKGVRRHDIISIDFTSLHSSSHVDPILPHGLSYMLTADVVAMYRSQTSRLDFSPDASTQHSRRLDIGLLSLRCRSDRIFLSQFTSSTEHPDDHGVDCHLIPLDHSVSSPSSTHLFPNTEHGNISSLHPYSLPESLPQTGNCAFPNENCAAVATVCSKVCFKTQINSSLFLHQSSAGRPL